MTRRISPPATVQDCCSWIVRVEYQGQTRNTRFLEHKPLINTFYRIWHWLELKYFHFVQFLLNAHRALKKVKTDILKFKTDLRDQDMDGWTRLVSNTVDDCLQRKIAQKSSNRKLKLVLSRLVTTWLANITFHLQPIWLQTLVAINSESRQTSFRSFCSPPFAVPVLSRFYLNLSRLPFLGEVVDVDLLLCTGFNSEHAVLFLYHISTNDWSKDWAKQWAGLHYMAFAKNAKRRKLSVK